jgi:hypothetical protein
MDGWIDILNVSVPIFKKVEWYEITEYVRPKPKPKRESQAETES